MLRFDHMLIYCQGNHENSLVTHTDYVQIKKELLLTTEKKIVINNSEIKKNYDFNLSKLVIKMTNIFFNI